MTQVGQRPGIARQKTNRRAQIDDDRSLHEPEGEGKDRYSEELPPVK
jgi:hypothetical protein